MGCYKLLHSKGNHKQNKRQSVDWPKILENVANQKVINFYNTQRAHTA